MGEIIGLNGQSLTRQQKRQTVRDQQGEFIKVLNHQSEAVNFLLFRTDIMLEVFKTLGVTEEQLHAIEEQMKEKYKRQAETKC